MVVFGAMEEVEDRSKCHDPKVSCTKHWAPKSPTIFGLYISKVCGYNVTKPLENGKIEVVIHLKIIFLKNIKIKSFSFSLEA